VPSLLALDAGHGPISQSRIGFSVQGYPDRKAAGHIVSNDLNSGNRLATGPLPHGLKAFLAKRPIVQADRFEFYHLKLLIRNKKPFAAGRTAAALLSYQIQNSALNHLFVTASFRKTPANQSMPTATPIATITFIWSLRSS